ncbi:MAG TPA: RNA methyltransferase, partial [Chitinophagaceae bacterium]|nr:RNA methyltransferase [Chitinophagaceae bacterium]
EIKDIQSLRVKKFRDEQQLFIAEGPKLVSELLSQIPSKVKKIYALSSWASGNSTLLLNIPCETITDIELEKISGLHTPNEVVGVFAYFEVRPPAPKGLMLYLDGIQDPGNMGTIIRIADWFGVKDIVCGEGTADMYNPKVVQATMASLCRVNIFYDEHNDWLSQQTLPKYAASLNGASIYDMKKERDGILIIGNESKGIRPLIEEQVLQKITIPRIGEAESLNAAVATGIILSHLLRQA